MIKQSPFSYFLLLVSFFPSVWGATQPRSKFEWGAGNLSFKGNHYRGSDQEKNYFIPLPYFIYTSETIEAEPSFIRGTFYKNDWFAIKLSLIAGLNVESEENHARQGMPELDYTFEAGPMVTFKLWSSKSQAQRLTLNWPFRLVNTTDFTYIKPIGFFSVPYLNFVRAPKKNWFNWGFELSTALMWGSRKYHNFYYGVAPNYATPNRPAYDAKAGYSGVQNTIILRKRWKNLIFIPFFRWDYLDGVAFQKSPLFKTRHYVVGGLGFFWLFGNYF